MSNPAELFSFDVPRPNSLGVSAEMRGQFEALGRLFYTSDPRFPKNPKKGMPRILDESNGVGVLLQWFDGSSWRTVLSGIENFTAGNKLIHAFTNETSFIIDHNFGSFPAVQILDSSNELMAQGGGSAASFMSMTLAQYQTPLSVGALEVWRVPPGLTGQAITDVSFGVATSGAGGDTEFGIERVFAVSATPGPLLATDAVIEAGELSSTTAMVQPVIAAHVLAEGDLLRFDVSSVAPTPPEGAYVGLQFSGGGGGGGSYTVEHISNNRVSITFLVPTTGTIILVG